MKEKFETASFFCQQIWQDYIAHFRSETTVKTYEADIGGFMMFFNKDFRMLTQDDVKKYYEFMQERVEQKVVKPGTVAKKFRELHSFAEYVCENREKYHVGAEFDDFFYPYLKKLEKQKKFAKTVSIDQIDGLLKAAEDDLQAYLILVLLYRVGLTSTEIVGLKLEDFALYENGMYVSVEGRKPLCYVPEDAQVVLEKYLEESERKEYLFYNRRGNQLNLMYISRLLEKLAKKAGVPKCSAESIRNTCGVTLYAYGANASQVASQLGVTKLQIHRYKNEAYADDLQKAANHLVKVKVEPPNRKINYV